MFKFSVILAGLLIACQPLTDGPDSVGINAVVTRRCVPCHNEGGIEHPLVDGMGAWMTSRVLDRTMPPGQPSVLTPELRDDPRLSFEEVGIFKAWKASGFAEKLEQSSAPLRQGCAMPVIMSEAYTPPDPLAGGSVDEYRCFLLPTEGLSGRTIKSYTWITGQPTEMHHIVAVVVDAAGAMKYRGLGQGWPCAQGLDVAAIASLGSGGTHETRTKDFGPDAGVVIPIEGGIIIQMHYLLGRRLPDQSGLCLELTESEPLTIQDFVTTAPAELPPAVGTSLDPNSPLSRAYALNRPVTGWTAQQIQGNDDQILANCNTSLEQYLAQFTRGVGTSKCVKRINITGEIRNVHLHAHTYAVGGRIILHKANGTETLLLDYTAPRYLWAWETIFGLQQSVPVVADDQIEVQCDFDNSPANQWSRQYGPSLTGALAADPVDSFYVPGTPTRAGEMCDGTVSIAVMH